MAAFLADRLDQVIAAFPGTQGDRANSGQFGDRADRVQLFSGVLQDFRLLSQSDDDGWMLGRNLKALTLWDLYQQLPEDLDLERLSRVDGLKSVIEPLKSLVQFGSNEMSVSLDRVLGGAN